METSRHFGVIFGAIAHSNPGVQAHQDLEFETPSELGGDHRSTFHLSLVLPAAFSKGAPEADLAGTGQLPDDS